MGIWGNSISTNSWKTSFIELYFRINVKKIDWNSIKKITIKKIAFIRFEIVDNKVLRRKSIHQNNFSIN
jgi:hypothetical protein